MNRDAARLRYATVRARSEALAAPLPAEDQVIQAMPDASPTKWHLAHSSWFFEQFLLAAHRPGYRPFHPRYGYLFNSYYEAVGPRQPRPARGMLGRPTVAETLLYRRHVDKAMDQLIADLPQQAASLLELGLQHEEQHQELLLTDIKAALFLNPLRPAMDADPRMPPAMPSGPASFSRHEGGIVSIGHAGGGFAFDNEGPRHQVLLRPYRIADRPVSNAEFEGFIAAGGYDDPAFWLSEGWALARAEGWMAPLYWEKQDGLWRVFTHAGMADLDPAAPVCHVSFFEAAAYAAWAGRRLPLEAEWEAAAACGLGAAGAVWEWTASPYGAYPGFKPAAGAIGEYNGKFMVNQMVLKGGSCATPPGHARLSYRNFFPPSARWQFSGFRLAEDA